MSWSDVLVTEAEDGAQVQVLVQSLDPDGSGAPRWRPAEDGQRAVLMAKRRMMVPMLNDTRRNEAYKRAIDRGVHRFKTENSGRGPKVLDIGAGTGLLSCLAAQAGARAVVGCEMNAALAQLATRVVLDNGLQDVVQIESVRSTDLQLGSAEKFDMIVTETLDSNLLSEGILGSIGHAIKHLCKPNPIIVPSKARVFAQPMSWPGLAPAALSKGDAKVVERTDSLIVPTDRDELANLQVGQLLQTGSATPSCAQGLPVMSFDFAKPPDEQEAPHFVDLDFDLNQQANLLCMWWELDVGQDGPMLTTDPFQQSDWQDHWFPVLLPVATHPPGPFRATFVHKGDTLAVSETSSRRNKRKLPGEHDAAVPNTELSRARMAQLADERWRQRIRDFVQDEQAILDLGDHPTIGLLAPSVASVKSLARPTPMWRQVCQRRPGLVLATDGDLPAEAAVVASDLWSNVIQFEDPAAALINFLLQAKRLRAKAALAPFMALNCGLINFANLASAMQMPHSVQGVDHSAAANVWNSFTLTPVDISSYAHQLVSGAQARLPFALTADGRLNVDT
ncbi:Protein arginine N-methyltransferase 7 [Durusdinium trenchii]|uniref:Protein arginine N-methyltransferase 7 n=1 Tax=Durusdinium trenchii TaxID=1381693 RepID=A0ABP0PVE4_9DINO